MSNLPKTLDEWWNFVKTDDPLGKARYFLRNQSGMGFTLKAILEFLGTKTKLTCHRRNPGHELAGSYSIDYIVTPENPGREIIFRVDPTTPTVRGSKPYPSVVICW